jgi:hypothetical protein
MPESNGPHSSTVSLDDLLKANKAQFDELFGKQMSATGLRAESVQPAVGAVPAASEVEQEIEQPAAVPGDAVSRVVGAMNGLWRRWPSGRHQQRRWKAAKGTWRLMSSPLT